MTPRLSPVYDLTDELFGQYNKHIRPVKDPQTITNVTLKLALFNVLSVVGAEGYRGTISAV